MRPAVVIYIFTIYGWVGFFGTYLIERNLREPIPPRHPNQMRRLGTNRIQTAQPSPIFRLFRGKIEDRIHHQPQPDHDQPHVLKLRTNNAGPV